MTGSVRRKSQRDLGDVLVPLGRLGAPVVKIATKQKMCLAALKAVIYTGVYIIIHSQVIKSTVYVILFVHCISFVTCNT